MWICPLCQTVYPAEPTRCVCTIQPRLRRTTAKRLAQAARWEQDKQEYIATHGPQAWESKVDREIKELFS